MRSLPEKQTGKRQRANGSAGPAHKRKVPKVAGRSEHQSDRPSCASPAQPTTVKHSTPKGSVLATVLGHFEAFHSADLATRSVKPVRQRWRGSSALSAPSRERAAQRLLPVFTSHTHITPTLPKNLKRTADVITDGQRSVQEDGPLHYHLFQVRGDIAVVNRQLASLALRAEQAAPGVQVSNKGGFHSERDLFLATSAAAGLASPAERGALAVLRCLVREAMQSAQAALLSDPRCSPSTGVLAAPPARPTSGWVNVNRGGDWNGLHDHDGASWSGVYYVDVARPRPPPAPGQPAGGHQHEAGHLLFRCAFGGLPDRAPGEADRPYATDPAHPEGWCQYCEVAPQEGLLVLFPSWMKHGVTPLDPRHCPPGQQRISIAFNFTEEGLPSVATTRRPPSSAASPAPAASSASQGEKRAHKIDESFRDFLRSVRGEA